jgi:hypothetical protein
MLSLILGIFKVLGMDILPKVLEAYNKKADTLVANNNTTAVVAGKMIEADMAVTQAKKENLATGNWVNSVMIMLLGLPVAIHWAAIAIDSTFKFGLAVPAMPGAYGEAEIEIVKSFFITGVAAATVVKVASIIKR